MLVIISLALSLIGTVSAEQGQRCDGVVCYGGNVVTVDDAFNHRSQGIMDARGMEYVGDDDTFWTDPPNPEGPGSGEGAGGPGNGSNGDKGTTPPQANNGNADRNGTENSRGTSGGDDGGSGFININGERRGIGSNPIPNSRDNGSFTNDRGQSYIDPGTSFEGKLLGDESSTAAQKFRQLANESDGGSVGATGANGSISNRFGNGPNTGSYSNDPRRLKAGQGKNADPSQQESGSADQGDGQLTEIGNFFSEGRKGFKKSRRYRKKSEERRKNRIASNTRKDYSRGLKSPEQILRARMNRQRRGTRGPASAFSDKNVNIFHRMCQIYDDFEFYNNINQGDVSCGE